ncbi:Cyclic nucleotide-binding domain-containing protein [Hyphomicrobium sp. 1Nfss2.1]|uniref:cyclic nucleotide-binding domain-containing protein n=1 Tax=Hyphomicrobium sp. 1Nfss2.1 TaxID=3413936 RepID=UPI003C7A9E0C
MTTFPANLAQACAGLAAETIPAGSKIVTAGEPGGPLHILIEGSVEVLRDDTQVATVDEPGAVFGEMALLLGAPHATTVIAKEDCRCYVIADGAAFLRSNPDLMFHVCRTLALRVHLLSGYLADLKTQFAHHDSHLGMVHEVLCKLCEHPHREVTLGSDRQPGPLP